MKSNCLIIEDEPHCKERLQLLLEKNHSKDVEISGWAQGLDEAIALFKSGHFDLVFCDIDIKGRNAFEILSELQVEKFDIIFTTAHNSFASEAFRVNALDYLLKPISQEELKEAIDKHLDKKLKSQQNGQPQGAQELKILNKRIEIPTSKGLEFIPAKDIIRCEADGNYTVIYLKDKTKLTVSRTLKEFEKALEKHHFIRPHQSHLVNIKEVKAYHRGKGGTLILTDLTEVEVASRRKEEILRILKST
ncbi:LytR/AlgR family response regulator transcription factor [Arthrospiribacter ruber]|uniref:DNA-binding response regulator n=1 Tax=Arthrospiribacter ruber TaxID=2487934 RepID=A0A951J2N9_9BACT|nr:LytTR family DNA-binding domain-containing protein [Arthrospiribacter ruber]MBW3469488.1 DNA-binding response regulator [Arthrospiribacter ruber]